MVPLCLVPALALFFFYVSTFRSMCAVPHMAAFCSSLTSLLLLLLLLLRDTVVYAVRRGPKSRFAARVMKRVAISSSSSRHK